MPTLSQQIKSIASDLGFDACGICRARPIPDLEKMRFRTWLDKGYYADMNYLADNFEKRSNPTFLVEGARSIISLALNYYPQQKQDTSVPQFAYYAYGKDYHEVMKAKMQYLFASIKSLVPSLEGRVFCDTAPVMERYWAAQAGLGFIGKNSLLIIPNKGSYFFLGELIVNLDLDYDKPLSINCGTCTRCMDACPTQAFVEPYLLDSRKCISYQTIENKGEIDPTIIPKMNNRIYGCDICQQVCPWNRFAQAHSTPEFISSRAFLDMSALSLTKLTVEEYCSTFKGSSVKRAKYTGLMRNLAALSHKHVD